MVIQFQSLCVIWFFTNSVPQELNNILLNLKIIRKSWQIFLNDFQLKSNCFISPLCQYSNKSMCFMSVGMFHHKWEPGPCSISDKMSHRTISWSHEAARLAIKLLYCFEIWQALQQHCCRGASQVLEWLYNSKYKSHGFETLWDLAIKCLIGYWNRAWVFFRLLSIKSQKVMCSSSLSNLKVW